MRSFLGIIGLAISFFPQYMLDYFSSPAGSIIIVMINVLGGFYIGFGFLNWMARANIIGAIYSRPVAVGNFIHFFVGAIVLLKETLKTSYLEIILPLALLYIIFAASFGYLLFAGGKSCS